jgi:ABC-2 type transport system ATP-binding protein
LSGIVDRFSGYKVISLQFAKDQPMDDLERFGKLLELQPPKARIRVPRSQVTQTLSAILAGHVIEDIGVEDPPLEQVIAEVFSHVDREDSKGSLGQADAELLKQ